MPDFNTVEEVIEELQNGHMVVLVDERTRDLEGAETVGEGELIMVGELATSDAVNFMMRQAGSPPVVTATHDRLEALELHPMVPDAPGPRGPPSWSR